MGSFVRGNGEPCSSLGRVGKVVLVTGGSGT